MRLSRTRAKNVKAGDQVVVTVARTMGMQGRKPRDGAPLMKIEFDDGTVLPIREDQRLDVLRTG